MHIMRWMNWTLLLCVLLGFSGCTSTVVALSPVTGWTARAEAGVNPHLALLEGQTRGATEAHCVPGPVWATSVPEERRLKPRIEILEFTDFECPYCANAQVTLERILDHFGPCTVRITTIPKPLPMHLGARDGAIVAARAAQDGPVVHEQVHRALFDASDRLSPERLAEVALGAGMKGDAVTSALADEALAAFVDWGVFVGDHAEARGTPTFFVNGHLVQGAQAFETFSEIIEGELKFSRDREGRWGDRWVAGRLALNAPVLYALLLEGRRIGELPESEEQAEVEGEGKAGAPKELKIQEVPVGEGDPVRGKASAPVTIVTFGDFECPFCRKAHVTLKKVAEHYGDRVRFVSKQYPLPFHEHARGAAKAVLCAHDQGQYWAFHDALYEGERRLSDRRYGKIAKKLKLNLKKFKRCQKSKEADRWVDVEMLQAANLGISGTPVSFVNGFRVGGAVPFSHYKAVIDAALGPDAAR